MIAIDSNLLIYAHRAGVPQHKEAQRAIERACATPGGCGIPLPAVAEFWGVVTHAQAEEGASSGAEASAFLLRLVEDGGAAIWSPGEGFFERLLHTATALRIAGMRVFDLQIAMTAVDHGAREIWTHDAEFVSLPGLTVVDPLTSGPRGKTNAR